MGIVTSIVGPSGSGKSSSFRTIPEEDYDKLMIIRTSKKPFPLKGKFKLWDKDKKKGQYIYTDNSAFIIAAMKKLSEENGKKIFIIEDSTFVMTNYFMETALDKGFEKFNHLALNYFNLVKAAEDLEEDVRIYLINHIDEDANGFKKVKTIGKMLDEKIDIPSLLTIVIESKVIDGEHVFVTNKTSSLDIAKSPMEMFDELKIPNDLKLVDKTICSYYGIEQ